MHSPDLFHSLGLSRRNKQLGSHSGHTVRLAVWFYFSPFLSFSPTTHFSPLVLFPFLFAQSFLFTRNSHIVRIWIFLAFSLPSHPWSQRNGRSTLCSMRQWVQMPARNVFFLPLSHPLDLWFVFLGVAHTLNLGFYYRSNSLLFSVWFTLLFWFNFRACSCILDAALASNLMHLLPLKPLLDLRCCQCLAGPRFWQSFALSMLSSLRQAKI